MSAPLEVPTPLEVPRKPDPELRIRVAKKVLEEAGYTISKESPERAQILKRPIIAHNWPDPAFRIRETRKILEDDGYTILAPGVRVLQKTAQASCPIGYYKHLTGFAAIIKDNLRRQLTSAVEEFVVIRCQEDTERALVHLQGLLTIVVEPTDG